MSSEEVKEQVAPEPVAQPLQVHQPEVVPAPVTAPPFVGGEASLPDPKPPTHEVGVAVAAVHTETAPPPADPTTENPVIQEPVPVPAPAETEVKPPPVQEEAPVEPTPPAVEQVQAAAPTETDAAKPEEPPQAPATLTTAVAANPAAPNAAGGNIVWRLQYVPVLQPMGENGEAPSGIPQPFPVGAGPPVIAQGEAAKAPGDADGEKKEGDAIATAEKAVIGDGTAAPEIVTNASAIPAAAPGTNPSTAIPAAIPQGAPGTVFPQFIVAPSNAQFIAPSTGSAQPAQYVLAPSFPQARISNDPNNGIWNLTLEDSTDLPLPLEDEVDLSCYNYKINLGKDVVSGKGGKVQQLNRHFRNMVAAAYPTYDATSSKISKRKIGLKIYQTIIDRGGRFLDIEGKPMDRPKSILKVMKALKDAKTWTSDAKRLAKRKRDEQKNREAQAELAKKVRLSERLPENPVVAVKEDPVAVAAVVAAVAAVDDVNKPAIEEAADSKIPATTVGRVLPTTKNQVKKDDGAPEGEGEKKPEEQQGEPMEGVTKTEPSGEPSADQAKDPDAVLQGLELLTKAADEAKPKDGEVQNTMQV